MKSYFLRRVLILAIILCFCCQLWGTVFGQWCFTNSHLFPLFGLMCWARRVPAHSSYWVSFLYRKNKYFFHPIAQLLRNPGRSCSFHSSSLPSWSSCVRGRGHHPQMLFTTALMESSLWKCCLIGFWQSQPSKFKQFLNGQPELSQTNLPAEQ